MGKISEKCKAHLIWANFELRLDEPRYKIRLWVDSFAILAYTIISIVEIWRQNADMIVLLLNILCLFRALLKNTMDAADSTKLKYKTPIEGNHAKHNYYHLKVGITGIAFAMAAAICAALFIESSNMVTKLLATISIFVVCMNDIDNTVIYAYDADVCIAET
ncbi:MAG: hypothetical protein HFI75_00455 [Lachnospiraceae bacterium]|nr:hypothetical protein [Lachnospiraceae bacterium]